MKELSPRQQEILKFLKNFVNTSGISPSLNEIAEHFSVTPATVAGHLRALQKKGFLTRRSCARGIVLSASASGDPVLRIPVYGMLDSPEISENDNYREQTVYLHRSAIGKLSADRVFALRITDESLGALGIFRDDIAIFVPADELPPRLGSVVLLWHNAKALIREYFPIHSGGVTLRATHPDIPVLTAAADELRIIGVLVSLQRNYQR